MVEKLGFRDEGLRRSFLHIDGAWRDHRAFALTAEELPPGGLLGSTGGRAAVTRITLVTGLILRHTGNGACAESITALPCLAWGVD